ncbi:Retinoblastoma-binding protein [Kickxella alabastrina]|uniref:Retinoblastoma-binding protein n=1 Tax=Kickxella alabastrina TaxID=61397 RepID=A0ACC1IFV0_9FUNG|nr:Retinoblastoma-binding protein [Kickxella alabastrina]
MSQIQYKFRSAKDYSSIVFDGLSTSVLDLKQEIMREQKLEPEEFELVITNEQTGEDYKDDMALVPKNTMVLVRRMPYTGPKMGRMSGGGHQQQQSAGYSGNSFNGGYHQRSHNANANGQANQYGYRANQGAGVRTQRDGAFDQDTHGAGNPDTDASFGVEDAGISAMLQQSNDQWMHQQSIMEMCRLEQHTCDHGI